MDGSDISVSNYISESRSVVITLKIDYLKTLEAGRHTLTAVFDDGDDVTVGFCVEEGDDSSAVEGDDSSAAEGDDSGEGRETPTGLPTIPVTGIPANTEKAPTTVPARTVTNTTSGTQKASSKTNATRATTNTSGSAQKAPTRAATRAAATGDESQIGVMSLLFAASLVTLICRLQKMKKSG